MSAVILYDSQGRQIRAGHQIGAGGEGTVYEIVGDPSAVLKVYTKPVQPQKVAKLLAMVAAKDDALAQVSAWPIEIARKAAGGDCCGLVMPRITSSREVHELFSPQTRRRCFPRADYRFLVHAARNIAVAFEILHSRGIVLGDVNEGNLLVDNQAMSRLIDCDSFQFSAGGTTYKCEVGIALYTPPELQGVNFRDVVRTVNHDCFGLAVLMFHMLFMGRHPFAGRFLGSGDMPLEKAISQHRFAYGANAKALQMAPPPGSMTLPELPQAISSLFERAFSESSARGGSRPSASEWRDGLEFLKTRLRECDDDPGHYYAKDSGVCPWCRLINAGAPNLFISVALNLGHPQAKVDIQSLRRALSHLELQCPALQDFKYAQAAVTARPLPHDSRNSTFYELLTATSYSLAILCFAALWLPTATLALAPMAIACGLLRLSIDRHSDRQREFRVRKEAASAAYAQFQKRVAEVKAGFHSNELLFRQKLKDAQSLCSQYEGLEGERQNAIGDLSKHIRDEQLADYLESQYLHNYKIEGIGPTRQAVLSAYGVVTAADVRREVLAQVPGFGPNLIGSLLAWRRQCEGRFRFDPSKKVSQVHLDAIHAKFQQAEHRIAKQLRNAPGVLKELVERWKASTSTAVATLSELYRASAQATADFDLAKSQQDIPLFRAPVVVVISIILPLILTFVAFFN
jgi:DNA-binding helix-hairpin-helix protein with protein kinase domain